MATAKLRLHPACENPFDRARALYEMAKADADGPHDFELSDDECTLLANAESEAADALLLTPAPDLAAVAYKLDVFAAQDCFWLCEQLRDPLFSAIIADVRRINAEVRQ